MRGGGGATRLPDFMDKVFIKHWNEGATMPLVLPVEVVANTPYAILEDHIKTNSQTIRKWAKSVPAHGRVAILCGSGPSLAERELQAGDIFALNAAADFLHSKGLTPYYQVLVDSKEESVSLVGEARHHYFGATVHPDCFKKKPDATLFQLQVEEHDLQDFIDRHAPHEYCMIAQAVSVGIMALTLVYALGYRKIHLYGYDSCHKNDESHVVTQKMNDCVPYQEVIFNGHRYTASLPMKLQAERISGIIRQLEREGCSIEIHGTGLLPDMMNAPDENLTEQEKYCRMWSFPEYRTTSPGETVVPLFVKIAKPEGRVIDFGCGTGRAAIRMRHYKLDPYLIDFAPNSRDPETSGLPFLQWDLTDPIPISAKYGFCADVLEHIPSKDVEKVITNIMNAAEKVFFQISTREDYFGAVINQTLHVTVKNHLWWLAQFSNYKVSWQQDEIHTSLFLVER